MKRRPESKLRSYQKYLYRQGLEKPYTLFAVDMGLGKTGAVLRVLKELRATCEVRRVLVIAPKRVASMTWPDEIDTWEFSHNIPFTVIEGTPQQRAIKARKKTFLHIINKENLAWLWKLHDNGATWPYDMLVVDEASMLKEGRKRRVNKIKGTRNLTRFGIIAKARTNADRVILMTGTPAPEGIHNLWGLMYILDQGERLGHNRTAFERRWFDKGFMGWDMNPRPGAEKQITKLSSDLMISLRAEDHLELPPVITTPDTDILIDFPKQLRLEYNRFERELFTKKFDVEAANNGVLVNKLLQFCNGFLYRSKGEVVPVHELKLDALSDLVAELDGHPLLVAYSFKSDAQAIKKRFGKKVTILEEAEKDWMKQWNARKIKILATHPGSISHGMNIQFGGSRICWYGQIHSGETYKQLNARLPRPGQTAAHVMIYHILIRNTWDETVLDNQFEKDNVESRIRKAVRIRRQEILEDQRREL